MLTDTFRGGAIGAGLFIGSGGAFQSGGPASVLLGFMIIGESAWAKSRVLRCIQLLTLTRFLYVRISARDSDVLD